MDIVAEARPVRYDIKVMGWQTEGLDRDRSAQSFRPRRVDSAGDRSSPRSAAATRNRPE